MRVREGWERRGAAMELRWFVMCAMVCSGVSDLCSTLLHATRQHRSMAVLVGKMQGQATRPAA